MKRSLSELIFIDLLFILFLSLSGFLSGILSDLLYLAAFVLPTLLFLYLQRNKSEESFKISASLSRNSIFLSAALAAPIVAVIMGLSFLTSLLMGAIGIQGASVSNETNLIYALVLHAIAPAIFEEMLFRYLPIRALGAESPRLAVIYSSVLFAFAHCNLFQIPYAIFAGFAFAAIDIAAGSVMPSILIHLFNNLLSILWERGGEGVAFYAVFLSALALIVLASVCFIGINREKIKKLFLVIFEDKCKFMFTYPLGLYLVVTVMGASFALVNSF